jgi:transposase, IS30 family
MERYKQLSYEERVKLAELRQMNLSLDQMSKSLGRSKSTLSRELRRNEAPPGQYWPDTAQSKALSRRRRGCLLDKHEELKDFVITNLCCHYWTPEQIAGWLKHRQKTLPTVSHETIYAWLYMSAQRKEKLWKFLPRHKAKRGLRKNKGAGVSRIPNRVSIHERPKVVAKRKEFGHWEGDLMSFLKNSQHILVLRERKTMFTQSIPLEGKKAIATSQKLTDLMRDIHTNARKTITLDNGGEFAGHERWLKDIGLPSYFCDPYASWQKGGVENTNGRLRRDLPRKTNVQGMKPEDFNEVIENYNMTPRKSLKWLTPLEAFNQNLRRVALQT